MAVEDRARAKKAKPREGVAKTSPAPSKPVQGRGAAKPKASHPARRAIVATFPGSEDYLRLVTKFPLRPIKDDAHLDRALDVVESLIGRELDLGSEDYLAVLVGLVKAYEREASPIPDASEGDVLELLMEQRGVGQTDLQREVGIAQSTVSAVLKGARKLTKAQVVDLARFFRVNPAVFLPKG
jgi:antitoxin component HigA of HigAB toxin-antitoxin module